MDKDPQAPSITDVSWGQVEVEDHGTFKDAKLWPGGARAWDWDETGTRHAPGVQVQDVQELLDHGARIVVLSRGMNRRLQVQDETLEHLRERGIQVEVLQTEEAVEVYNELVRRGLPVGALLHSTC